MENNKSMFWLRLGVKVFVCWHTDNFWAYQRWKEAFSPHLWAFTREQRAHSSLLSLSGSGQWQCRVLLYSDGSNTPRQFFIRQPARNTSWFGLATLHTQVIPVTPITIKNSYLDPRNTLLCYFNDPNSFAVAVTPRLGFQTLLCRSDRSPEGRDCPCLLCRCQQWHLLDTSAIFWLLLQAGDWEMSSSAGDMLLQAVSLLSRHQFVIALI